MGAPQGNQFWRQRTKVGRDRIFKSSDDLWLAAQEYFQWCDDNPWIKKDWVGKDAYEVERPTKRPYTMVGLCVFLGVNSKYFFDFKDLLRPVESATDKAFSDIITYIEDIIRTNKYEGAVVGAYNPVIISRDLGFADKQEISATTTGVMQYEIIKPVED